MCLQCDEQILFELEMAAEPREIVFAKVAINLILIIEFYARRTCFATTQDYKHFRRVTLVFNRIFIPFDKSLKLQLSGCDLQFCTNSKF